ncbi:MAG TPA: gluconokinase [Pseudonocardia sp.]|jgi:gluconokinase|uniref:gluconokinase n=1 Tax=Pseudonocardia sp. TaxID=60912 RepID=UPI002F3EFAF0
MTHDPEVPVLVVMGVSGSGKSTLAMRLAADLGWDFQEGDDLHPPANVAKMSSGVPLDDDDRAPWLDAVAGWIDEHTASGRPGIITCSALRRAYRDRLRRPEVVFVHLTGDREAIAGRLATRAGHFMPSALLESQLATLEPPAPPENVLQLGPELTPAEQAAAVIELLGLRPAG